MCGDRKWMFAANCMLALALFSGLGYADNLEIAGSTDGTFYLGPFSQGTSVQSLTYTSSNFDTTSNRIDLGTFTLSTCLVCLFTPYDFRLTIDFTLPTGVTPDPLKSTADVTGAVVWTSGNASVNFSNTPIHMSYSNTSGSGAFDLTLNDVSVNVGQTAHLYGSVSTAKVATPESESIVMLATICCAILWIFRKRFAIS